MTLKFDPNLDKRHLAIQEKKQVVAAYFKSNTSKDKDYERFFFLLKILQEM